MNHTNENIVEYITMLVNKRRSNIVNSKSEYDHFDTKSYYISNSGNDNNDGLSPEQPWATLNNVNNLKNTEKVNILFKRGDTWRGNLHISGKATVSAYGEGPKPLFLGSPENGVGKDKWALLDGTNNIWMYYKELPDCGTIILNDGELCAYKYAPAFKESYIFKAKTGLNKDISFFIDATSIIRDNTPDTSDVNNVGTLFFRCDKGNPGEVFSSIEFSTCINGLTAEGDDITVNNIALKYYGKNGMTAADNVKGFIAYMNEISWIGGCIDSFVLSENNTYIPTRGGCGDYIDKSIERHFVDNTIFSQIYEAAVSHRAPKPTLQKKLVYSNNLIETSTYSYAYSGMGMDETLKFNDITFMSNICLDAGCGWGKAQHSINCKVSHVKTWNSSDNCAEKMIVRNNILYHSADALIRITAKNISHLPKLSRNIYVQEENKVFGVYGVSNSNNVIYENKPQEELSKITNEFGAEFYFA